MLHQVTTSLITKTCIRTDKERMTILVTGANGQLGSMEQKNLENTHSQKNSTP